MITLKLSSLPEVTFFLTNILNSHSFPCHCIFWAMWLYFMLAVAGKGVLWPNIKFKACLFVRPSQTNATFDLTKDKRESASANKLSSKSGSPGEKFDLIHFYIYLSSIIKHPKGCLKLCFCPSISSVKKLSANLISGRLPPILSGRRPPTNCRPNVFLDQVTRRAAKLHLYLNI